MRSGNPSLGEDTFSGLESSVATDRMTLFGTACKTMILLAVLSVTFGWVWNETTKGYTEAFHSQAEMIKNDNLVDENGEPLALQISIPESVYGYGVAGCLGGFVLAMLIIFNPGLAPYLSIPYAALEGLALGTVSAAFEAKYPGIAFEAALATFGTLFGMLAIYMTGLIKVTDGFRLGILAAMVGILVLYLGDMFMQMLGFGYVGAVHDSSWTSIGLSCFIVLVAALNLVLDFDSIERGVEQKAPAYMEWYGAFSLMVTLVWLYLEILRLLAKARGSNNN